MAQKEKKRWKDLCRNPPFPPRLCLLTLKKLLLNGMNVKINPFPSNKEDSA